MLSFVYNFYELKQRELIVTKASHFSLSYYIPVGNIAYKHR